MFERFTDRARRVVVLAQEQARQLDHSYIGAEHLLLGLLCEGEGVAAKTLQEFGLELEIVRTDVKEIIGSGDSSPNASIPFDPGARKALELALGAALSLGHNYIGTEHILLGLVREGEGILMQVLTKHDLNAEMVKEAVYATYGVYPLDSKDTLPQKILVPSRSVGIVASEEATMLIIRAGELAGIDGIGMGIVHVKQALQELEGT